MNQALEKDIVDAMHHLNTEQLRDVKRFVEHLSTAKQLEDLVTDEELTMIMELSASKLP
ncbi:hypothetical protein VTH8203_01958 [Vibrio thalassae]|uniref:Uncharacterized protein n=1 Tax=Vibrio thalassae TaxID=1243014 RepID=A0A240EK53_9VIBR|nr:hypothetical protein [Vibrio thalassae]SNX48340.1 hypothetical protein VTH8203_01958 [Vibrio thalassae]